MYITVFALLIVYRELLEVGWWSKARIVPKKQHLAIDMLPL